MPGPEAIFVRFFVYSDPDHVSLAGMHDALDAVEPGMELSFKDRLEIGLHALAGNLCDHREIYAPPSS
jgi:hypothetical protein